MAKRGSTLMEGSIHLHSGILAAVIYSLIAAYKLCEIDPFAYLRDVLDRISTHPASRIAELTPSHWMS